MKALRLCYSFFVHEVATQETDDAERWYALQHRLQHVRTARAVGLLRSRDIEPIVIKGVAATRYYPLGIYRPSIDVDLAVGGSDFQRAREVVSGPAATGMAIDLHCELRHLDTVAWDDLVRNSVDLELPEGRVRVLRPEDDLRVLTVHWLTDGGVYRERLWDLYYLVDHQREQLDWSRVLDIVPEHRRRWLECTLGLTAKYLGLDLSGTPLMGAVERLPKWLIATVEREWAAETKPVPLEASLTDRRVLFAQIRKRMRPNPIYATVDCEGSFDAPTRLLYRLRNAAGRVMPSYRRVSSTLSHLRKARSEK